MSVEQTEGQRKGGIKGSVQAGGGGGGGCDVNEGGGGGRVAKQERQGRAGTKSVKYEYHQLQSAKWSRPT